MVGLNFISLATRLPVTSVTALIAGLCLALPSARL